MTHTPADSPPPATPAPGKLPLPELAEMKRRGERIVMITAYDAPAARIADAAGVELDPRRRHGGDGRCSATTSTVPVTLDEMIFLTRAVTRALGARSSSADMPFGIVRGLGRAGGRERDPLRQGGRRRRREARGRRAHARTRPGDHGLEHPRDGPRRADAADRRRSSAASRRRVARPMRRSGCSRTHSPCRTPAASRVVLEAVPAAVAARDHRRARRPDDRHRRRRATDGQVLVWHDMLGHVRGADARAS